jgi:methylthioribulose-1-phosphate dehydratase
VIAEAADVGHHADANARMRGRRAGGEKRRERDGDATWSNGQSPALMRAASGRNAEPPARCNRAGSPRGPGAVTSLHPSAAPAPDAIALDALTAFGRFAASRGWVPATAGNFSVRLDADHAVVTRSGIDKGNVGPGDVAVVPLAGPIPVGMSAETPLHLARYRAGAQVGAVVHVHTLAATVLSRADAARGAVRFDGFEMQKALAGVVTHESVVDLPIFANDQDTVALAERIEARLVAGATVPGYLLAGHGLYAWGATMSDARRHLEGLEFLLACTLEERRLAR